MYDDSIYDNMIHPIRILDTREVTSSFSASLTIPCGSIYIGKSLGLSSGIVLPRENVEIGEYVEDDTLSWYNIGTLDTSLTKSSSRFKISVIGGTSSSSSFHSSSQSSSSSALSHGSTTEILLSINDSANVCNGSFYSVGIDAPMILDLKITKPNFTKSTYNLVARMKKRETCHQILCIGPIASSFTPTFEKTTATGTEKNHIINEGFHLSSPTFVDNNLSVSGNVSVKGISTISNKLIFDNQGNNLSPPSFANRSPGTKIVLQSLIGSGTTDYAIGMQSGNMWFSVESGKSINNGWLWYGGLTQAMKLDSTGQLSLNSGLFIGTGQKRSGTSSISLGKFNIYGLAGSLSGPHMTCFVSTDTEYPVFQQTNRNHDAVYWNADAFHDGKTFVSSSRNSNFQIAKGSDNLSINYSIGIQPGDPIIWSNALKISSRGTMSVKNDMHLNEKLNVGIQSGDARVNISSISSNAVSFYNRKKVGGIVLTEHETFYGTDSNDIFKENIAETNGETATKILMSIKSIKYDGIMATKNKTNVNENANNTVHGFLAENLKSVFPEAVMGGTLVDYSRLVPLLVSSLQDAWKEIQSLKETLQGTPK